MSNELIVYCIGTFVHFFFSFEVFRCTKCKFVLVLRTFLFLYFLSTILNFGRYLPKRPKTPEIDRNDPKFF